MVESAPSVLSPPRNPLGRFRIRGISTPPAVQVQLSELRGASALVNRAGAEPKFSVKAVASSVALSVANYGTDPDLVLNGPGTLHGPRRYLQHDSPVHLFYEYVSWCRHSNNMPGSYSTFLRVFHKVALAMEVLADLVATMCTTRTGRYRLPDATVGHFVVQFGPLGGFVILAVALAQFQLPALSAFPKHRRRHLVVVALIHLVRLLPLLLPLPPLLPPPCPRCLLVAVGVG